MSELLILLMCALLCVASLRSVIWMAKRLIELRREERRERTGDAP